MRKAIRNLIGRLEQWESLDSVATPVAGWVDTVVHGRRLKNLLSGTWLGHPLHPMLTDLPIGLWTAASAFDLLGGKHRRDAAQRLVGLGVLAAVPTAAAGASDWADSHGPKQRLGLVHALGNDVAVILQSASWLARRRGSHRAGVALSLAAFACTAGSAYLGGYLSFGRGMGVDHTAFQEPEAGWSDVAADGELAERKPMRVMAGEIPVVLVKQRGRIFALSATCTHAGGPLDEGTLDDDGCIICPWHHSEFRLADGEVRRGPATAPEPAWQVKVSDGRVQVRPAATAG